MKKDDKDIFKEFQDSLKNLDGTLHVLDASIPIEKQMEYFNYSDSVRKNMEKGTVENQIIILNDDYSSTEEIQYALTFLAVSGDVKAYRALEIYTEKNKDHLNDWAILAMMQARITLESEFSEEKQIFISTGLGGKDGNFRFYSFFKSNKLVPFSAYQKSLIEKEFPFFIEKSEGIIEEIKIEDNYFTLIFLINLQIDIRVVLRKVIDECNQYGNFIDTRFVITNVKIYSREEIEKELLKDEE
ncbi:MAG: hypothetical protein LBH12_00770 [Dysgonamonadaceae bacterium]|jgi:hypothetical protein|nr:hypothetical protein [Dysgonamonadaceae bacterium]